MKLRTLSIFAAAAIVSLTACGGDEGADGETVNTDTTAVQGTDTVATPTVVPTTDTVVTTTTQDTIQGQATDTTGGDTTAAATAP